MRDIFFMFAHRLVRDEVFVDDTNDLLKKEFIE